MQVRQIASLFPNVTHCCWPYFVDGILATSSSVITNQQRRNVLSMWMGVNFRIVLVFSTECWVMLVQLMFGIHNYFQVRRPHKHQQKHRSSQRHLVFLQCQLLSDQAPPTSFEHALQLARITPSGSYKDRPFYQGFHVGYKTRQICSLCHYILSQESFYEFVNSSIRNMDTIGILQVQYTWDGRTHNPCPHYEISFQRGLPSWLHHISGQFASVLVLFPSLHQY